MRFVALLLTAFLLHPLSLVEWGRFKLSNVEDVVFGDSGELGVCAGNCAYVINQRGEVLAKACGTLSMSDASYCCGTFAFANYDGFVYMFNGTGWRRLFVGYADALSLLPNGLVACGENCVYSDFNGTKGWVLRIGWADNGPSVHGKYIYVADWRWGALLVINVGSGKLVTVKHKEPLWDTAVCGDLLAVSGENHLYLYNVSDPTAPRLLWRKGDMLWGKRVAFSPDCKYIAVDDALHGVLKVFDADGRLVLKKDLKTFIQAVAWWENKVAVALDSGEILIYLVK